MNSRALEYWIIMFYRMYNPIDVKVNKAMFEIASRDEKATVELADGRSYIIMKKRSFQHLNKWFLVAEVEKKQPNG